MSNNKSTSTAAAGTRIAIHLRDLTKIMSNTSAAFKAAHSGSAAYDTQVVFDIVLSHSTKVVTISKLFSADINGMKRPNEPAPSHHWPRLFKGSDRFTDTPDQTSEELLAGRHIAAQHKLCMASFSEFLAASLRVLQGTAILLTDAVYFAEGRMTEERQDEQQCYTSVFNNLLCVTCSGCEWLGHWLPTRHPVLVADTLVLVPQLHAWMTWWLSFLRGGSTLLEAAKVHGDQSCAWQHFPLMLLCLATNRLDDIRAVPDALIARTILDIPISFIDTLCCIVCELCPEPSELLVEALDDKIHTFVVALARQLGTFLVLRDHLFSVEPLQPELVGPAAMEVAKIAVTATCVLGTCTLSDTIFSQTALEKMYEGRKSLTLSRQAGFPLCYQTVPRLLITDKQLVDAACIGVQLRPDWDELITGFIGNVIGSWDQARLGQPQLACIPSMLQHCMAQVQRWMELHRSPQLKHTLRLQRKRRGLRVVDELPMVWSEMMPLQEMLMFCIDLWFAVSRDPEQRVKNTHIQMDPQELKSARAMPESAQIRSVLDMPGSVAVMEAIIRDARTLKQTRIISTTLNITTLLQVEHTTAVHVQAQVSMVTSLLKILQIHTKGAASLTSQEISLVYVVHTTRILAQALEAVLARRRTAEKANSSGHHSSYSSYSGDFNVSRNRTCGMSTDSSSSLIHSLRQLSAVLCLGMVRMVNFLLRTDVKSRGGLDATEHCEPAWLKVLEAQDTDLAAVVLQLLLLPFRAGKWHSVAALRRLEPRVWSMYALTHFHGRLLSGCCHLGCINLAAVSEAALPTLLCSGCKRVRYCSEACQRAAWVAGGHGEVCGRGDWSIPNTGC